MKTEKRLELTGYSGSGLKRKLAWSLGQLTEYLEAETPDGWLVDEFHVTVSPLSAVGRPEEEGEVS